MERINVIPADDIYKLITLLQSIKNVLPSSEKFGKLIVIDSLAVLFFPFIGAPNNQGMHCLRSLLFVLTSKQSWALIKKTIKF